MDTSKLSPLDEESFLEAGLDLADFQQNFLLNGSVKVTFVAPEKNVADTLLHDPSAPLRVATTDEIFALKCLACADRNKSRDWFDLYILMQHHGYGVRDLYDVFARSDALSHYEIAQTRLRACRRYQGDEGYEQLLDDAPSDEQMRAYFNEQLDQLEIELAAEAFREHSLLPPPC
jgi:hypothetical protein